MMSDCPDANASQRTQAGDPAKGARVMWEVAHMADPPLRIAVGTDAYSVVTNKVKEYGELYPKYKELSSKSMPRVQKV